MEIKESVKGPSEKLSGKFHPQDGPCAGQNRKPELQDSGEQSDHSINVNNKLENANEQNRQGLCGTTNKIYDLWA